MNEKQIISKIENRKHSPRQGVEANGLDKYEKNLPGRVFSSCVLLVIMSGKTKLKSN